VGTSVLRKRFFMTDIRICMYVLSSRNIVHILSQVESLCPHKDKRFKFLYPNEDSRKRDKCINEIKRKKKGNAN
jgi:hypothetical protein